MKHLQTFESYDPINELFGFSGKEKKEASQAASSTIQAQSDLSSAEAEKVTTKTEATIDKVMKSPKFVVAMDKAMDTLKSLPDDELPDTGDLNKIVETITENRAGVDAKQVGDKVAGQAQIKEFYSINEEENMAKKFLSWLFTKFGLGYVGAATALSGLIGSLVSIVIAIIAGGTAIPILAVISAGAAIVGVIVALIGFISGAITIKLKTGSWPNGFGTR